MSFDEIQHHVRLALALRAAEVTDDAVDRVRRVRYPVRGANHAIAFATAATVAAVASGGAVYLGVAAPSRPPAAVRLHAATLAYVGKSPRLAVTQLPPGFSVGPNIPWPTLPGQPAPPGAMPQRTFVSGTSATEESIVLAEGANGEGPVPKLLAFAAAHPAITSQEVINGTNITVVDLAAIDAGAGFLLYWPVSSSSWALLGGSAAVTVDQLLTVAAGTIVTG